MLPRARPLVVCFFLWGIFLLVVGFLAADDNIPKPDLYVASALGQGRMETDFASTPLSSLRRRLQSQERQSIAVMNPKLRSHHLEEGVRYLKEDYWHGLQHLELARRHPLSSHKHLVRQLLHFVNHQKP